MASFQDKVDHYGLTNNNAPLVVIENDDGASNEYNEYHAQNGSFIDHIVYGEKMEPSDTIELTGDWSISADTVKLGGVSTVDQKKFALSEVSIETTAGELPSVTASGKQVQNYSVTVRYYAIPSVTVKNDETAQVLWDAFTLSGTGCHLQSAKYTAKAEIPTKDKDAFPLAFGVSEGVIECEAEIIQCSNTEPTITAGEGWHISDNPKATNPDSDCPTWSVTLRKYLVKTVPTTGS